jgi:NitT/TauT family transport system substrate-binding protein
MGGQDSISRRRFLGYAGALGVGLSANSLLAACGTSSGPAAPLTPVTFLLDVAPYGKHALFYVPLQNGYWKEQGLDVSIHSAQGSLDCVNKVAAQAADFGFADTGSAIIGRGQGALVKEVAMVHYRNLMAIIGLDKKPIRQPSDIEGKTLGATAADAPRAVLPIFAKINNIDINKVKLLTMDQLVKPAALTQGRCDGTMDFFTAYPAYQAAAQQQNLTLTHFLYADNGLDIYNNGIIARDETIASKPDLVRKFVLGLIKGIVWTIENPDKATQILIEQQPGLSASVARAQLQIAIDFLMVDEVKKHGIGPMDPARMAKTLDVISQAYTLKNPVKLEDIYTNSFVPKNMLPKK